MTTNFIGGLLIDGSPLIAGNLGSLMPSTLGQVFHVDYAHGYDDIDHGSADRPLKTVSYAHSRMTADQDDICILHGGDSATTYAFRESTTLTWSKDKCHLIGASVFNRFAHRVSIRALSTATVYSPFINVTASGCVFANFHAYYGFNNNSAQVCWLDEGERNYYNNVHIGGFGHATAAAHTGARALVVGKAGTGFGEHAFENCVFGIDTTNRTVANYTLELLGATPRNIFKNCLFTMRALTLTTQGHLLIGAEGIDRFVHFDNCTFINTGTFTGGATMAQIGSINAAGGGVVIFDSRAVGITALETAASGIVFVQKGVSNSLSGLYVVNAG